MIFAFATDERSLTVFPDERAALSYCEGIDVEDGVWQFFDESGKPLVPVFSRPNSRGKILVRSGEYTLLPSPDASIRCLIERLSEVATVIGKPPLTSIAAIEQFLRSK